MVVIDPSVGSERSVCGEGACAYLKLKNREATNA